MPCQTGRLHDGKLQPQSSFSSLFHSTHGADPKSGVWSTEIAKCGATAIASFPITFVSDAGRAGTIAVVARLMASHPPDHERILDIGRTLLVKTSLTNKGKRVHVPLGACGSRECKQHERKMVCSSCASGGSGTPRTTIARLPNTSRHHRLIGLALPNQGRRVALLRRMGTTQLKPCLLCPTESSFLVVLRQSAAARNLSMDDA